MSYFTDDEPYKSTVAPLVVDTNNMPEPSLGFIEQNIQTFRNERATGLGASETKNIAEQLNERASFLEEDLGPDFETKLKEFGYERGAFGAAGDPWLSTGRDDSFEEALRAYRETLSGDKKSRLRVGDEIEKAAKDTAKQIHEETTGKLSNTKYGGWAGLPGTMAAHTTDPFEMFAFSVAPWTIPSKLMAAAARAGLAGRVSLRAGSEAAAVFSYETPAQFGQIKPYKNELDIPYTNIDAANAVFAATVFSGLFGGTFELAAGAFRKVKTGEWTPQQAREHLGQNYQNLKPEEREMVDMALQLEEHERLNPYGPSEEGRKQFNKESAAAAEHAHGTGRKVSDDEVLAANEAIKPRDEDVELQELREAAIRDAGLEDTFYPEQATAPEAAPFDQFEPVLRAMSDNFDVGDEISGGALSDLGLDAGRIEEFIEYARQQGYLKQNDGADLLARGVTDKSDVVPKQSELPAPMQAIAARIVPEGVALKLTDKIDTGRGARFQAEEITDRERQGWIKWVRRTMFFRLKPDATDDEVVRMAEEMMGLPADEMIVNSRSFGIDMGVPDYDSPEEFVKAFRALPFPLKKTVELKDWSSAEITMNKAAGLSKLNITVERDGKQIADAIAEFNPSTKNGEITRIEVDESARRQGVATAIYDMLDNELTGLGGGKMRPSTTNQTDDAKAFWAKRRGGGGRLQLDESGVQGAYSPQERLIQISRAALDPEGTLRHEAMEALFDLGYFKKEEWDMLEASAIEGGWIKKHNIEERYKDIYDAETQRGDMLREAINEEYAAWARGETVATGALEKLFERVRQLLGDVARVLRESGINDYVDIFKMVESGEVKARGEPEARLIDVDGVMMTPENLIRSADNDIAMAENISLCAKMAA